MAVKARQMTKVSEDNWRKLEIACAIRGGQLLFSSLQILLLPESVPKVARSSFFFFFLKRKPQIQIFGSQFKLKTTKPKDMTTFFVSLVGTSLIRELKITKIEVLVA